MNLQFLVYAMAYAMFAHILADLVRGGTEERRASAVQAMVAFPLNITVCYFLLKGMMA